jgi:hypothetical protein
VEGAKGQLPAGVSPTVTGDEVTVLSLRNQTVHRTMGLEVATARRPGNSLTRRPSHWHLTQTDCDSRPGFLRDHDSDTSGLT